MSVYRFFCFLVILASWIILGVLCECENLEESNDALLMVYRDVMKTELRKALHVTNSVEDAYESGYFDVQHSNTSCFRMKFRLLQIVEETSYGVYSAEVRSVLDQSSIILGDYFEGVQVYISQNKSTYYLITSPVGYDTEWMIEDAFLRLPGEYLFPQTFAFWPSPRSFAFAVLGNVMVLLRGSTQRKVLLLTFVDDEDGVYFIDDLYELLTWKKVQTEFYDLSKFSIKDKRNQIKSGKVEYVEETIHKWIKSLRDIVSKFKPDLIIFHMDETMEEQVETLRFLFRKGSDLDRPGMKWLIADLDMMTKSNAKELMDEIQVVNSKVYAMQPCLMADGSDPSVIQFCLDSYLFGWMSGGGPLTAATHLWEWAAWKKQGNFSLKFEDVYQSKCPAETEISDEEKADSQFLYCQFSPTVRRPGFLRYDLIRTIQIKPRPPPEGRDRLQLAAIYYHKDTWDTVRDVFEQLDECNQPDNNVRVLDYMVQSCIKDTDREHYAVLVQEWPFVVIDHDPKTGVTSYSGLCIDIYNAVRVKLLEKDIKLDLKFYETKMYGSRQDSGRWTGVFGELSQETAVLGIGQISKTKERTEDKTFTFSPVFAHTGHTYMTRKLSVYDGHLHFLRPFSKEVWCCFVLVAVFSSIYIRLIIAWNPWKEEEADERDWTFRQNLWHSYLVLTQMGAPRGMVYTPSRIYEVIYWFFAVVVVGCYTGNLTGFLTESPMETPDIVTLVNDEHYQYGLITNSSMSSERFSHVFGRSHQRLRLDESRLELVDNYTQGVQKVKNEKFIMIGTSLVLESYERSEDFNEDCSLDAHHNTFYDRKIDPLAFPMRTGWDLAEHFNEAMTELKESGALQVMYHKHLGQGKNCDEEEEDETTRLGWENFAGLYILVAAGIIVAYSCLVIKLIHVKMNGKSSEDHVSRGEDLDLADVTDS